MHVCMYVMYIGTTSADPKEGFYLGPEITKDDPRYNSTPFHGENSWPDATLLPQFRDILMTYHAEMNALALRLSSLLFRSISLDTPDLTCVAGHFDDPINALRLISYPPTSSDAASRPIYGVGPHTDSGILTILHTDENPGLQIRVADVWHDIPARPGCFIVNLADMLQRWTNVSSNTHNPYTHVCRNQHII